MAGRVRGRRGAQKSQFTGEDSSAAVIRSQSGQRSSMLFERGCCPDGVLHGMRIHRSHRVGIQSPAGTSPGRTSVACLIALPMPTIQNRSGPIWGNPVLLRSKNLRSVDRMNSKLGTTGSAQQADTRDARALVGITAAPVIRWNSERRRTEHVSTRTGG